MNLDSIGPSDDPKKYKIIKKVGEESVYGNVYKSERVSDGKLFAVKVIKNATDSERYWLNEVNCLVDVIKICSQVGILCFEEAFIHRDKSNIFYIIVTPFLEDYITINTFLKDKSSLSLEDAIEIYRKIVDVKNAMTETCGLSHSDLHTNNIMIDPKKMDIKVIDLGLCKTSEEEKRIYGIDKSYRDETRLSELLETLIQKVNQRTREAFGSIKIKPPQMKCIRRRSVWKVRNSEEFEKQVNYFINKIEKSKDEDEIELLFHNLLEFIEANESMMGSKAKIDIVQEVRKKKNLPELEKYKKILGEKISPIKSLSPESKKGSKEKEKELSFKIVSSQQEWNDELSRLMAIQQNSRLYNDKIKTIIDVFEFILNNNPRYIQEKLLNAMIKKAKELSIDDKYFQSYLYRLQYLKVAIQPYQ